MMILIARERNSRRSWIIIFNFNFREEKESWKVVETSVGSTVVPFDSELMPFSICWSSGTFNFCVLCLFTHSLSAYLEKQKQKQKTKKKTFEDDNDCHVAAQSCTCKAQCFSEGKNKKNKTKHKTLLFLSFFFYFLCIGQGVFGPRTHDDNGYIFSFFHQRINIFYFYFYFYFFLLCMKSPRRHS